MRIEKSIPVAAGLGGAAPMRRRALGTECLDWQSAFAKQTVGNLRPSWGRMCPFACLAARCWPRALGKNCGRLPPCPMVSWYWFTREKRIPPARCTRVLTQLAQRPPEQTGSMLGALEQGNLGCVAGALGNAFEGLSNVEQGKTARPDSDRSGRARVQLVRQRPTVYGVFARQEDARIAKNRCIQAGFGLSTLPSACTRLPCGGRKSSPDGSVIKT